MSTGPTKEKVRVRAEGFGALGHLDVSTTKAGTFCRPDARQPRVASPKPASAGSTARISALLSWTAAPSRYHRLLRQQLTGCCSAPARSCLRAMAEDPQGSVVRHRNNDGAAHAEAPSSTVRISVQKFACQSRLLTLAIDRPAVYFALVSRAAASSESHLNRQCRRKRATSESATRIEKGWPRKPAFTVTSARVTWEGERFCSKSNCRRPWR
jgi:hypothetical protein